MESVNIVERTARTTHNAIIFAQLKLKRIRICSRGVGIKFMIIIVLCEHARIQYALQNNLLHSCACTIVCFAYYRIERCLARVSVYVDGVLLAMCCAALCRAVHIISALLQMTIQVCSLSCRSCALIFYCFDALNVRHHPTSVSSAGALVIRIVSTHYII